MYPSSPPMTRSRLSGNTESETKVEVSLDPLPFDRWTDLRAALSGSCIQRNQSDHSMQRAVMCVKGIKESLSEPITQLQNQHMSHFVCNSPASIAVQCNSLPMRSHLCSAQPGRPQALCAPHRHAGPALCQELIAFACPRA